MLKHAFDRISRYFWNCGVQRTVEEDEFLMVQKVLSSLFHLAGVHSWRSGKFVEIFEELFGKNDFKDDFVKNIEMIQVF